MIFLHDSVKTDHFSGDKKLELLKKGVITISQFVNLIEPKDDYIMIGPAVVAKYAIKEFMTEWRMHQLNIDAIQAAKKTPVEVDEMIEHLQDLCDVFPEISSIAQEMNSQLTTAICPKCVKNRYAEIIAQKIRSLVDDGRDLGDMAQLVERIINQFFTENDQISNAQILSEYDEKWLKPENLLGLGYDLIDNLPSCFDCAIKHISRAKTLFEEFLTGYPSHEKMMFNELDKGNTALEKAYLVYLDSMAHIDMASCELVGNLLNLPRNWQIEMIELANEIRAQRLLYQDDPTKIPDFDGLRLKIKKLQIKTAENLQNKK